MKPALSFAPTHSPVAERSVPAWAMLAPWFMLLPLLFFCANGSLIPETTDAAYRVTASAASDASHRGPLLLVLLTCSGLMAMRLPLVFAMCQRLWLILALPLLALLSTAWSLDPQQTIQSSIVLLVVTLFAIYMGSAFNPQKQFEILILAGAVGMALSLALIAVAPGLGINGENWRGIFSNKQNAGSVSTLLIITAVHWSPLGLWQKAFRALFITVCLLMLVMSHSRTGWILCFSCLCLTAVIWGLQKLRTRDAFLFLLLSVPTLAGSAALVYQFFAVLARAVGKDPTLNQRTIIWAAVWNAITQHFYLGYGYAAFWNGMKGPSLSIVLIAGWVLAQSQDGYLDLWLQVGFVGVLILIAIIIQAGINLVRSFRVKGQGTFVRWCAVVMAFTLVLNIGESSVAIYQMAWFTFLLACVGLSQTARLGASHSQHETHVLSTSYAAPGRALIGKHAHSAAAGGTT